MTSSPRFSVIVPTRERAETLGSTLRTCLDQDYDDYEIVVCDNCSSPATRQVVEELASPRIRYFRSSQPLSMSANWELAVGHAQGQFLTILGDDDGLMPYALRELDALASRTGASAIRWEPAFYLWPTVALADQANYLRLPTSRELRILESRSMIRQVIHLEKPYPCLPMIYNSVIRRDLLDELRHRTGQVFGHIIPDVYSGFAVSYLAERYASVEVPMTVSGLARKSNGIALLFVRGPSAVAQDFEQLNQRPGLALHPQVPDLPIFPPVPVADAFLIARQNLFPADQELCWNRAAFIEQCVRGIPADNDEGWRYCLGIIRQTLQDDLALLDWFDTTWGNALPAPAPPARLRSERLGFDGNYLHLDASQHGVQDVAGAVQLCESILNHRTSGIVYGLKSSTRYEEERGETEVRWHNCAADLQRQLLELSEEAQRRQATCARLNGKLAWYRNSTAHRLADRARNLVNRLFRRAG